MSSPSLTHTHTHGVAPHTTTPFPVPAHHSPRPRPAQRYLLEALCCRKRINHSLMPRPLATPAGQQRSSPAGQSAAAPLMSQIKKHTHKKKKKQKPTSLSTRLIRHMRPALFSPQCTAKEVAKRAPGLVSPKVNKTLPASCGRGEGVPSNNNNNTSDANGHRYLLRLSWKLLLAAA